MRDQLHQHLQAVLEALLAEAGDRGPLPDFALEVPRRDDHGDFACNAAMLLARRLRQPPRAIAERMAARLAEAADLVERVEVAGPGFVNIWLAGAHWQDLLRDVLAAGARYGSGDGGAGTPPPGGFLSANPAGPPPLGHGRQAGLGGALARLLEAPGRDRTPGY